MRLHVQTRFAVEAVHWLGARRRADAERAIAAGDQPARGRRLHRSVGHGAGASSSTTCSRRTPNFADSSLSTTTFVLAMNKAAYDKLPRDLKTVIDDNSGQPAASIAGAMWDLQAAAVADMVRQPRRSDHHAVAGSRGALAQSHRAGDRGLAEGHEGAQGRRRQAPRQRPRAAGEIRGRARAAAAAAGTAAAATRRSQGRADHAAESRGNLVDAGAALRRQRRQSPRSSRRHRRTRPAPAGAGSPLPPRHRRPAVKPAAPMLNRRRRLLR